MLNFMMMEDYNLSWFMKYLNDFYYIIACYKNYGIKPTRKNGPVKDFYV